MLEMICADFLAGANLEVHHMQSRRSPGKQIYLRGAYGSTYELFQIPGIRISTSVRRSSFATYNSYGENFSDDRRTS